ncbi:hypothetical protein ACLESO_19405 [Pyxidicoccus sp. 3LG]
MSDAERSRTSAELYSGRPKAAPSRVASPQSSDSNAPAPRLQHAHHRPALLGEAQLASQRRLG